MKRLALIAAIVIVGLYVAWRNDMLRWPPFGPRTEAASGAAGRPGPGGRGGRPDGPGLRHRRRRAGPRRAGLARRHRHRAGAEHRHRAHAGGRPAGEAVLHGRAGREGRRHARADRSFALSGELRPDGRQEGAGRGDACQCADRSPALHVAGGRQYRIEAAGRYAEGACRAARGAGEGRSGEYRQREDDARFRDDPLADRRPHSASASSIRATSFMRPMRPASSW